MFAPSKLHHPLRCIVPAAMALAGVSLGLMGAVLIAAGAIILNVQRPDAASQQRPWLEQKIEDSRAIQRALARPLPAAGPLVPITARAKRTAATPIRRTAQRIDTARLSNWGRARNAFATVLPPPVPTRANAYDQSFNYIH